MSEKTAIKVYTYAYTEPRLTLIHLTEYTLDKNKEFSFTSKHTLYEYTKEAEAKTNPFEEITLSFVGDIMLADGPGKTIDAGNDPLILALNGLRGVKMSMYFTSLKKLHTLRRLRKRLVGIKAK